VSREGAREYWQELVQSLLASIFLTRPRSSNNLLPKIAERSATSSSFDFVTFGKHTFTTTIPPSGKVISSLHHQVCLVQIEQIGLHLTSSLERFVSCAQIRIINGGGSGNPIHRKRVGGPFSPLPRLGFDRAYQIPCRCSGLPTPSTFFVIFFLRSIHRLILITKARFLQVRAQAWDCRWIIPPASDTISTCLPTGPFLRSHCLVGREDNTDLPYPFAIISRTGV
jgi:hypothetical protein